MAHIISNPYLDNYHKNDKTEDDNKDLLSFNNYTTAKECNILCKILLNELNNINVTNISQNNEIVPKCKSLLILMQLGIKIITDNLKIKKLKEKYSVDNNEFITYYQKFVSYITKVRLYGKPEFNTNLLNQLSKQVNEISHIYNNKQLQNKKNNSQNKIPEIKQPITTSKITKLKNNVIEPHKIHTNDLNMNENSEADNTNDENSESDNTDDENSESDDENDKNTIHKVAKDELTKLNKTKEMLTKTKEILTKTEKSSTKTKKTKTKYENKDENKDENKTKFDKDPDYTSPFKIKLMTPVIGWSIENTNDTCPYCINYIYVSCITCDEKKILVCPLTVTSCNHTYHEHCFKTNFDKKTDPQCILCNQKFIIKATIKN